MTGPQQPRAGRREWIGLAVIALPCLVYAMDLTVLNLAVPALSASLQPSSAELLWIVDIYGFMAAGLLITMGTLGDRIGRRRILMIGAAAFALASLLAAFSTNAAMLIGARALLGVAGAALAPSTLSLIRNMFLDPGQRTVAIGVWIASFSVGAAIGPLVGGALLTNFWWGSVFLPAIPVMVLVLAVGPRLLPESKDPDPGRLDASSAAMSLFAVLAVIYGLKHAAQDGIGWVPALAVGTGIAAGGAFLRRQGRLSDPLLDIRLFRRPAFSAALGAYTAGFFVNFGALLFIGQYLQLVQDLTPLQAGALTVPAAVAFIIGSMAAPMVVRRARPSSAMTGGLLVAAVGFTSLTQVHGHWALATLVFGSIVFSLGLSVVFTLATDLIVGSAPKERAGAASAISETGAELGGALGIAILGTVATVAYRAQVADAIPAGVSPDAARDTLGGAASASQGLPDPLAAAFLDAAQNAFTQGFHLAAWVCAGVALTAALATAVFLRDPRPVPLRTVAPALSGQAS